MFKNIDDLRNIKGSRVTASGESIVSDTISADITGWPSAKPIKRTFTDSSSQSTALTANQQYMFQTDFDCYVDFTGVLADSTCTTLFARVPYYFKPTTATAVAVLRATDDNGTLEMTPIND